MTNEQYISRLNECGGLHVIFQLTDKCVLSCKYCFARGAHEGKLSTFQEDVLELAIKQAFETRHHYVVFEWTGGEALLVGIEFFKKVIEFQKKYATKDYENGVQTSGNLYDEELFDFLIENNFGISTTIDGTPEIHNANRPTHDNRPSFDNVQRTRNYIIEKGQNCGFISTITKNNLGHEKEMLSFFRKLNLHSFHSNPYIYYSKNKVKDQAIALSKEDFSRYFISQFNAWIETGKVEPIPLTIDYIISCLKTHRPSHDTICTYGGRCLTNFIALTPNGDAYSCPKFTGSTNMILGNIKEQSISKLLSPISSKMSELINDRVCAINKCENKNCGYFYICNGGCPYHSFITTNGEDVCNIDCLCDGKISIFRYLESVLDYLSTKENNPGESYK